MNLLRNIFSKSQNDFLEKKPFENPVSTDFHSHLIFGVDDGSETLEQTIELLRGFEAMGMRKVITTPHIMGDFYKNDAGNLIPLQDTIIHALQSENINIEFKCAAEYLIDDSFEQKIEEGNLLTFGSNRNYILVELPFLGEPPNLKEALFKLQINGITPILAHPERYLYYLQNKKRYDEFKEQGILLQLNLLSTLGYYGKPVYELATYLVKSNFIDLVGSDTHRKEHQELLPKAYQSKLFYQLTQQTELLNKYL